MINKEYKINLKCFFCKSYLFEVPNNDYEIQSGDMIRCANCGQLNDVYYLKKTAVNKLTKQVEADIHKQLNNMFKKL